MENTNVGEILNFIRQVNEWDNTNSISLPNFLKPFHLAMLSASCRSKNCHLDINHSNESYINRMGLYEAIGQTPPNRVTRNDQTGQIIEARAVEDTSSVHRLSIEISEMFTSCADNRTQGDLEVLISEILQNCCAHSVTGDTNPFGLVCGQAWRNGGLAQLAIVDTGIGIRASLSGNPELTEELQQNNSCMLACEYGITGKPNSSHSGYGLALAKGLAENNHGRLIVISNSELYISGNGEDKSVDLDSGWNGTIIIFEWNLNNPLDSVAVYNNWPCPTTMDEDEYDEIFD
ncbi:ATP-binding protein [Alteromonas gilva]|uniref:ATP-binding protein n=1 Tax=Alteromonas gilva TaxID=2987522 RepID=A0ABT5L5B4_9ALTE|nr:ATP-binding protein [Alteromonas gilva]MDC8832229.1 ATP-binding protein [Alteromonas gilva]